MGLPVYLFLFQNWNISANISLRVFAVDRVISSARLGATLPFDVHVTLPARFRVIDGVISTAQLGATLPFDVQVTLPARFRVIDGVISTAQLGATLPFDVQVTLPARFQVIDGVISSAQLGATLPFDVRVTLPARFRVNLYTALWVNKFVTPLWVNDRVILPAQVCDILPIDVQVILPACFRVNLSIALWVNKFATPLWVNDRVVSPVQVQAMLPAHFVVNLHTTLQWVNDKGYFNNVQLDDHAVQRIFSYQHTIMHSMDDYSLLPKKYYVSVSRNPTEQYDVTNHPYFIFHPNQSEFSSFSETFKGYAYHLLQYRLIRIIEFIVCWCDHMCHFMSQNVTMLVNFDWTPKQYCRKLRFTLCQSQFYKHDFAVISSSPGPSANYLAVSSVKYLESIICQIIQHKYICKMSIWSGAKEDSKSQFRNCINYSEHNPSGKIGGGPHGLTKQKIEMEVIRPFIINTQQNSHDDKMCEFVEHLEISKGLKKYQGTNHLLCNIPLHMLTTCLFKNTIIPIGHKHDVHIARQMTKSEMTELFKIHDGVCEHKYVTVFYPYTQISSSE